MRRNKNKLRSKYMENKRFNIISITILSKNDIEY